MSSSSRILWRLSVFAPLAAVSASPSQPLVLLTVDGSLLLRREPAILPPSLPDHVTFSAQRSVRAYRTLIIRLPY